MLRFGETKVTKEKFYAAKKIKTNSKYLIGHSDKAIWLLVLIMPEMSEYVKTFKTFKVKDGDKDKNNKLTSFHIDEKLLGKYKIIWTKIEDLKNINFLFFFKKIGIHSVQG